MRRRGATTLPVTLLEVLRAKHANRAGTGQPFDEWCAEHREGIEAAIAPDTDRARAIRDLRRGGEAVRRRSASADPVTFIEVLLAKRAGRGKYGPPFGEWCAARRAGIDEGIGRLERENPAQAEKMRALVEGAEPG